MRAPVHHLHMPLSDRVAFTAGMAADDVLLPDRDIRKKLDERAFRNLTESSRRAMRVSALVMSDMTAGLLGVATVLATWNLVSGGGRRPLPDEVPLVAMVLCLQPLALSVAGAYGSGKTRTDLLKVAGGVAIAALLGWVQSQLFGREVPELPNKAAYLYSASVIIAFAWLFRAAIDRAVVFGYRAGVLRRRVVVLGSPAEAARLDERCRGAAACEFEVVGRLSAGTRAASAPGDAPANAGVPCVGTLDDLESALSRVRAQGVIVASNLAFAQLESLAGRCFRLGAIVSILPHALTQISATQLEVRQSGVGSMLQLRPLRLAVPQLLVKRAMDLALTLAGLALTWPLFLLIGALVKLDSRGPVLFRQTRAGVGGRPFEMLKFRTMSEEAEVQQASLASLNASGDRRLFKIRNDPRVTRVGRYLRRMSLDELPQLINVLKGEMSLVGPRPFFLHDLPDYRRHHFERLHVLPGITGLWQVSGRSDVTDFEEVIRLDREYIENWSVFADVAILLRTLPAVLGRGAY